MSSFSHSFTCLLTDGKHPSINRGYFTNLSGPVNVQGWHLIVRSLPSDIWLKGRTGPFKLLSKLTRLIRYQLDRQERELKTYVHPINVLQRGE